MLVIAGIVLVVIVGPGSSASLYQAPGVVIDFEENDVHWADVDFKTYETAEEVLKHACKTLGYEYETDPDGNVVSLNGIHSGSEKQWNLWVVESGSKKWTLASSLTDNPDFKEYTVSCWAYRGTDEVPSVGTDYVGNSIYGYGQATRTISLSPAMTEIIGLLNAVTTLVGTDSYSNYPESVVVGKQNGEIDIVGDFLSPIYEKIVKNNPDMVFCDGSQLNHHDMSQRLKKISIPSLVLYPGSDTEAVKTNIQIIGVAIGYGETSKNKIEMLENYENQILTGQVKNSYKTMIALSPDMSPWVSGGDTYVNDVMNMLGLDNVFSNMSGWVHINSEMIAKNNPEIIVILTDYYNPDAKTYEQMIKNLPGEWKSTDAYKNGRIFLIGDGAADMSQRSGPRYVQFLELMTLIVNPDNDIPKYIGDGYRDYLKITSHM